MVAALTASPEGYSMAKRVKAGERRNGAFYPPKILPPPRKPGPIRFLRLLLNDPLLSIPPEAYEESVVVRHWPTRIAYASHPNAVREVLVDRRSDFDLKPYVQRFILGPLLGEGILLAEGLEWRWQRQTTAPVFRHAEMRSYVPVMSTAADNAIQRWRESGNAEHMIDADMVTATYEVIARTLLIGGGERITESNNENAPEYGRAFPWALAYGLLNLPRWLPRPGRSAMEHRDAELRRIVEQLIDNAASESSGHDLLARLRNARNHETGQPMTKERLIDNVLTFLLAGHHTTAMALTWTLYLIACAPEWEERLIAEIQQVVPQGPVTLEHVNQLHVVQQVIKESLRLFPPVPNLSRIAVTDTKLGGFPIPKGTIINFPVYAIHRHKRVWDDPDRFDPTRFSLENEKSHASCQFIPFGAGPRICIGMAFAMIETAVFLATFLRAARFQLVSDEFVPLPASQVVLHPKGGLPLRITMRN